MKKIITILLISMLAVSFTGCGNSESSGSSSAGKSSTVEEKKPDTVGNMLLSDFTDKLNADPSADAQAVADAVLADKIIPFAGMTMPVEPGLLNGFGNTEITGFSEGVNFGPAIGSIPFIGYIFTLDDGTNADDFVALLKNSGDLRWNICTEAEELVCEASGNKVFFVMCTKSFEEDGQGEDMGLM